MAKINHKQSSNILRSTYVTTVLGVILAWLAIQLVCMIAIEGIKFKSTHDNLRNSDALIIANDIRDGMQFAFQSYMRDAWKADEYMPVEKKGENTSGGRGYTIIDSLDTLFMMDLKVEYMSGIHFVKDGMRDWRLEASMKDSEEEPHIINVFETNKRVLGGLLAAYSLDPDNRMVLLSKAEMVGEVLLRAFPQRIPCGTIDTSRHRTCGYHNLIGNAVNAEVGTLALEFMSLSELIGDPRWSDKIISINQYWREHSAGLLGQFIDPITERMSGLAKIDSGIDSTYEYFIKLKALTGDRLSGELYEKFEKMIVEQMFVTYGGTTFVKTSDSIYLEHSSCFLGGMLIMGQRYGEQGLAFTETCARMYTTNPSGLACDEVVIEDDGSIRCTKDEYLLRPEAIESIFYAWRYTHDQKWRNYAKNIWSAIDRWTQVESGGFTSVRSVSTAIPEKMDKQEHWFLAETMKYLWLIFQPDDVLPLDKYVFNTAGHPIKKFI